MRNNASSKQIRTPGRCNQRGSDHRALRNRRHGLDTVSRLDATSPSTNRIGDLDPTLRLDPHDVDADGDRCRIFVQRQHRPGSPQARPTVANRGRPQGHDRCPRDPRRTNRRARRHPIKNRTGQALVEMAFLTPMLVIIIGATISFGLFFYQANVLQQAVDVAAMEISRMPLPATASLGLGDLEAATDTVMYDAKFRNQIYDERHLIIHDSEWDADTLYNESLLAYIDTLPLLNRLLAQVMVRDKTYGDDGVWRYPGAIVINSASGVETVLIPIVEYGGDGSELSVQWVAPVEEIRIDHDEDSSTPSVGPFSLVKPMGFANPDVEARFTPGMVALRINYPAQSTTLINRVGDQGQIIVEANDSSIADGDTGANYSLVVADETGPADTTIHSGRYGLGRQAALLRESGVRPYRKVLSVQAIYRREVFE